MKVKGQIEHLLGCCLCSERVADSCQQFWIVLHHDGEEEVEVGSVAEQLTLGCQEGRVEVGG